MEAVELLADGDDGVRSDPCCYYNLFFDYISDKVTREWRAWSTLSPKEVRQLEGLQALLIESLATTRLMGTEELIASGWPTRIAAVAGPVWEEMKARGRFDEEVEQSDPRTIPEHGSRG
ncbi:hypothetical protein MFM001_09850 [Mycobacterium sp. MFM001]|nr:hypothetical protein MFM001_09850 [Mycobacterium sp. MFM001]